MKTYVRHRIGLSCRMPLTLLFLLSLFPTVGIAAAGFQLRGEVWTNLGGNGGASIRSSYRYDDHGYRILKETRPAPDTTGPVLGQTVYSYDTLGRPAKTVLMGLSDTFSIVEYRYNPKGNLSVTYTEDKTQAIRLSDSLFYDSEGRLVEARRRAGTALTQSHRFSYDGTGRLASDTLYENQGGSFGPAQVFLTSYGQDGVASGESHYRKSVGEWYLVETVKMGYAAGKLTSLVRYHGDGTGGLLEDSTAYDYDFNGNRSFEKGYDEERQPTYTINFDWRALGPEGILSPNIDVRTITLRFKDGTLHVTGTNPSPLIVSLRDVRGILIRRQTIVEPSSEEFSLPVSLAKGFYMAEVVQGAARTALAVMNR